MKSSQPNQGDMSTMRYVYKKDAQGRIHRYIDRDYKPRPGYYRLKWLEKPYLWWKFKSFDFKNAIIPIFLSIAFGGFIFNVSMEWSQRQVERDIKARLPEEFTKKNIKEYIKNKNKGEEPK